MRAPTPMHRKPCGSLVLTKLRPFCLVIVLVERVLVKTNVYFQMEFGIK